MIEHISLRCTDPKRSRDFYAQALAPIGYIQDWVMGDAYAFKHKGHHDFWVTRGRIGTPLHVAFNCDKRSQVDAFYEAALAAGGSDHGAPALRRDYGPNYYAAYVLDPDGHNIEAVSFEKPRARSRPAKRSKPTRSKPTKRTSARGRKRK